MKQIFVLSVKVVLPNVSNSHRLFCCFSVLSNQETPFKYTMGDVTPK